MKIGIASNDWSRTVFNQYGNVPGGANYIRLQQWQRHSEHKYVSGLLATHPNKGFGIVDHRGTQHYDIDVVIMQRIMHRQLTEDLMSPKNRNKLVINDLDDWYWGLHRDNLAYQRLQENADSDETLDYYKSNIKLSDVVVVSTPFLFSKMAHEFSIGSDKVHMIENRVDTDKYKRKPISSKKPILGWVGSTLHRSMDLEILQDSLSDGEYRMHHTGYAGGPTMASKIGIDPGRVTTSPMFDPYQYGQKAFTSFDVGLAPLNDVPFNHAKSWIKAIEYAAAGIPFVCSDISEYRRLQTTYGIGRLASTSDEWKQHLAELKNHSVRKEESEKVYKTVREHLDVREMAKDWDALISNYT
jgi:glycosyltransferase involved in cell wall biosynthesis